ncbi:MAG: hypothetical protein ACLFQY_14930, partial [Desulfococcaceae bacterium]
MKRNAVVSVFLLLFICAIPSVSYSAVKLGMEVNPNPVRPGEIVNVAIILVNDGTTDTGQITLELLYPAGLSDLDDTLITTGGSSNTVDCPGPWCDSGELVTWNIGNISSRGGIRVTLPPLVSRIETDGTLIQFEATAKVNGIQQAQLSKSAVVKSNPFFELEVDENTDPVKSTDFLEYTLTYGNIGTSVSDTHLIFPIPVGTNFISATGGGTEEGGEVTWNLGSLTSGAGGERRVVVQVNTGEGDILEVESARITGMDSALNSHEVIADRITQVNNDER